MPDIRIEREHSLGLARARKLAFEWAQGAQEKLHMACTYEEGKTLDRVSFSRAGVHGELRVTEDRFEIEARLGFLLGAFKDRIEQEIGRNLDELLAQQAAAPARSAASEPDAAGRRKV